MAVIQRVRAWWEGSLALQTTGLMLLCLIAAQWVSTWVFCDERAAMLRVVATQNAARELALIALLPEDATPPRDELHVWTSAVRPLVLPLEVAALMPVTPGPFMAASADASAAAGLAFRPGPDGVQVASLGYGTAVLSLPAADGGWVNAAFRMPEWTDPWAQQSWSALLLTSVALMFAAILISRRITAPMRALALAADRFVGARAQPIVAQGPGEVSRTLSAFNEMQERISALLSERTQMLSAIGHDLRTPMTRLRLRAHLIDQEDMRGPVLHDLDQLEDLTDRALDLARGAGHERFRQTDLARLFQDLVTDLQESGIKIEFDPSPPLQSSVQIGALRRAVANLIENAHRYAGGGRLALQVDGNRIRICVSDTGPGIPEDELRAVTQPFVRLERSRSCHTGGSGLGLALARATAQAHGGNLILKNRQGGGLCVAIEWTGDHLPGSL